MCRDLPLPIPPCLTGWLPHCPKAWLIKPTSPLLIPFTHAIRGGSSISPTYLLTSATPTNARCFQLLLCLRIIYLKRRILLSFLILPARCHPCGHNRPWSTWLLAVLPLPPLALAALAQAARLPARPLGATVSPRALLLERKSTLDLILRPLLQP